MAYFIRRPDSVFLVFFAVVASLTLIIPTWVGAEPFGIVRSASIQELMAMSSVLDPLVGRKGSLGVSEAIAKRGLLVVADLEMEGSNEGRLRGTYLLWISPNFSGDKVSVGASEGSSFKPHSKGKVFVISKADGWKSSYDNRWVLQKQRLALDENVFGFGASIEFAFRSDGEVRGSLVLPNEELPVRYEWVNRDEVDSASNQTRGVAILDQLKNTEVLRLGEAPSLVSQPSPTNGPSGLVNSVNVGLQTVVSSAVLSTSAANSQMNFLSQVADGDFDLYFIAVDPALTKLEYVPLRDSLIYFGMKFPMWNISRTKALTLAVDRKTGMFQLFAVEQLSGGALNLTEWGKTSTRLTSGTSGSFNHLLGVVDVEPGVTVNFQITTPANHIVLQSGSLGISNANLHEVHAVTFAFKDVTSPPSVTQFFNWGFQNELAMTGLQGYRDPDLTSIAEQLARLMVSQGSQVVTSAKLMSASVQKLRTVVRPDNAFIRVNSGDDSACEALLANEP